MKMGDGLGDEGPGAAGGVEHVPIERVGHDFAHHRARQPVGGVVLTQLAPLVGRDDALVQDGGDIGGRIAPVEPGHAVRYGFDQRQSATYFQRPGEEVRLHDSLQAGVLLKAAPQQQVRRVVARQLVDIDAKRGLHGHADHGAEVGVADEEVVHFGGRPGDLSQSRQQQVVP